MGMDCSKHGKRNAYRILVVKPEGKKPLGRTRYSSIKMDLREVGSSVMDYVDLVPDRDQCMDLVYKEIKCQFL
jgi:hypothetical protein